MPTLAREPEPVGALDDLLHAARSEAESARAAYAALATKMRAKGRVRLAEILTQLAAEEAELRELLPPPLDPQAARATKAHLALEELEGSSLELADAYSIWALAVRNADRAFARWSYAAAHAPNADVRTGAEQLARAHLILASARRLRRRAAFRADRSDEGKRSAPLTLDRLEAHLSGLLACHEVVGSPTYDPALADVAAESRRAARNLETLPAIATRRLSPQALGNPAVLAEAIVDGYFDGMNAATDEAVLKRLQHAAAGAVRRLERLRHAAQ